MKPSPDALVLIAVVAAYVLTTPVSHAQPYLGLQVGQSWHQRDTMGSDLKSYELDEVSTTQRLSIGYSKDWWSLEMGYSPRLSERNAHGTSHHGDDVYGTVKTSAVDVRGKAFAKLSDSLSAGLIGGFSWVRSENHEYGFNPTPCEWRNSMSEIRPLYGVGARYDAKAFALTAEFIQIANVAQSEWTLSSDVTTLMLGVQVPLQ